MLGVSLAVYGKTLAEVVPVEGGPQVVVHSLKARYGGGHKFIVEQLANFGIWWLHTTKVQLGYFIRLLQGTLLELEQVLAIPGQQRDFNLGVGNVGYVSHSKF
jgi:hypothetical protein